MNKVALLFPGQGSQQVGMCAELYKTFKSFKETIQQAEDAASLNISKLMLDGPEHLLKDTENTQPCLVAASYATLVVLKESFPDFKFDCVAGHSLGEYTALAAIGALSFETAIQVVRKRGQLMKAACDNGGMAAIIGLSRDVLQSCCNEQCVIANDNCPGQLVISGLNLGLAEAMEAAKKAGAKIIKRLDVSGPFHSPWMETAKNDMMQVLTDIQVHPFIVPYYPNILATPVTDQHSVITLLLDQITGPVKFRETLLNMETSGVTHFLEVGPGKVLSGLATRTCPTIPCQAVHTGHDVEHAHARTVG